jgi:putative membrane protein
MKIVCEIFVMISAFLHLIFFKFESIDFLKPSTLKRFNLTPEEGKVVKVWAFNQGFYNLFLAIGLMASIALLNTNFMSSGIILAQFILLTMVGADVVLIISAPKSYKAGLIQAIPATIAFILSLFL